ncbi:hypothetical protein BR93DRAFT_758791 [Coniochaeta sp. PMI_546]|nr:hypothetical protein BR93DRAFT_758791 [Coniochaeta sp. PMI_546]
MVRLQAAMSLWGGFHHKAGQSVRGITNVAVLLLWRIRCGPQIGSDRAESRGCKGPIAATDPTQLRDPSGIIIAFLKRDPSHSADLSWFDRGTQ